MVDKTAKAPVATDRLMEYWAHGEGAALRQDRLACSGCV
jgi:hypothetical protein